MTSKIDFKIQADLTVQASVTLVKGILSEKPLATINVPSAGISFPMEATDVLNKILPDNFELRLRLGINVVITFTMTYELKLQASMKWSASVTASTG